MGTRENNLAKNIKLTLPPGQKMVRFNTAGDGAAFVGDPKKIIRDYYDPATKQVGVFIPQGRPLKVGKKGWGDYIGYTPVIITYDMVNMEAAIFTAAEAKTGKQKLTEDQLKFTSQVLAAGGIHEIWREPAEREIKGFFVDIKI